MNINNPTTFSTPDLTLSTSNSSGTAGALRADDTILVYDTTNPANVTLGSAATGSAAVAARRDHVHSAEGAIGDVDGPGSSVDNALVRFDGTGGKTIQAYTSNSPTATDAGIVVLPGQPAFAAILTSNQTDKTGDDTNYTIPFDSTRLNQGTVFNTSNYTFTAPVTGQYILSANIEYFGATTSTTERVLRFITSNLSWAQINNFTLAGRFTTSATIIADMDADDTCTIQLSAGGDGSKVIDIAGDASGRTNFCGCLIA